MSTKRTNTVAATNDVDDLISIKRAAEMLGVSRYTMRLLVREGTIPQCRVRNLVRVRLADVRAYIDEQFAS